MAGSYPDVPGRRMAYDLDGTVGIFINQAGTISSLTVSQLRILNDESNGGISFTGGNGQTTYVILMFPELRDIAGARWIESTDTGWSTAGYDWATSTNTTTGADGTWTVQSSSGGSPTPTAVNPAYRTGIAAFTATGVRAIRLRGFTTTPSEFWPGIIHIFGSISSGQNPDRLDLWHPTSNIPLDGAYFDLGDQQQAGTISKTFRIKNQSSTLTANSVTFDTAPTNGELTPASPTSVSQVAVSNGGAYAASVSAGTLAPGAISSVLTLRRNTLTTAQLGLQAMRVRAYAASWT
jgi:hypothetical protein